MAADRKDRQTDENENEAPSRKDTATHLDRIIESYKQEAKRRDTIPKLTLYKYENEKTGTDRIFAGYFVGDEIPNTHEIGLLHGSGRYKVQIDQPKGTAESEEQISCTIKIHAIYDEYKARNDEEKRKKELARINLSLQNAGTPAGSTGGVDIASQSFLMVKEILALILPVFKESNKTQAAPRQENAQDLLSSYATMQKILKNNLFETAETFREYNRRYHIQEEQDIEDVDEPPQQTEREPGILETIIKLIEPFFGLIAQKSQAGKIAAASLKAAPQFLEVLHDPVLCRTIVQYFDKTKGREKSDIALRNIGIDRVRLFAQPQTAARSPGNGQTRPAARIDGKQINPALKAPPKTANAAS